jgi:hypothetical protein
VARLRRQDRERHGDGQSDAGEKADHWSFSLDGLVKMSSMARPNNSAILKASGSEGS